MVTDSTGFGCSWGADQHAARYVGGDAFMLGRNRFTFLREGGRTSALRADLVSLVSKLKRLS